MFADLNLCYKFQIDDVVKMYEKSEPFQFMHCWKMLRNEPKWNDKLLELSTPSTSKLAATMGSNAQQGPDDNAQVKRPEGRDTAKRWWSREDTASSSATVEVLQQIHDRNKDTEEKQDQ